jgi:hypothetical protein
MRKGVNGASIEGTTPKGARTYANVCSVLSMGIQSADVVNLTRCVVREKSVAPPVIIASTAAPLVWPTFAPSVLERDVTRG